MKRLLLCTLAALALAACQEDEAAGSDETETESTQSAAPSTESESAEDTATADDGGGAMDGADESTTEDSAVQTGAVDSSEVSQDAIDACIDGLRAQSGATGGTVLSTEFSEANSLVVLEDSGGMTWRCLVSNDGSNPSLESEGGAADQEDTATADDGGGAMDGAASELGVLADFVGARGGQAEGGLTALGFEVIRSEGLVSYWFNRETGVCAQITTSDGVYSDITILPAEDC
ncbi:hypothetical protein ACQ5SP_02860 [Rhodovulum sp. YNF3179]|uniref:hypothetical protein n=1 Tax=Rhodovulum sp. YNF3179 TaxID=3425127 RepID=UPI003D351455